LGLVELELTSDRVLLALIQSTKHNEREREREREGKLLDTDRLIGCDNNYNVTLSCSIVFTSFLI